MNPFEVLFASLIIGLIGFCITKIRDERNQKKKFEQAVRERQEEVKRDERRSFADMQQYLYDLYESARVEYLNKKYEIEQQQSISSIKQPTTGYSLKDQMDEVPE